MQCEEISLPSMQIYQAHARRGTDGGTTDLSVKPKGWVFGRGAAEFSAMRL